MPVAPTAVASSTLCWNPSGTTRALLVHGLGSSAGTWWRVADALAAHDVCVVAPDLRGHGASPRTLAYGFDAIVADLCLLGEGWDLAVGHSLAGPILARFAATGATRALLLLDPVMDLADDAFEDVVRGELADLDPAASAGTLARAHPGWHPQDAFQKAVDLRTAGPHAVEHCLRDNHPYHHLADLGAVAVPTTVLGADPVVGTMCPAALVDGLGNPAVTHRHVPGAGHGIHRDAPGAVVAEALRLLGRPAPADALA